MRHHEDKDAAREREAPAGSSDPPDPSAFGRFEEFARKVVSVPKAEIDERERAYRESRDKLREKPS